MNEDGAAAPDAGQPIDLESREMSVLAKHKSVVFLVGAFAIMIIVGVLTS
jgi:hypothetical protein